jgi:hypothetical protein
MNIADVIKIMKEEGVEPYSNEYKWY